MRAFFLAYRTGAQILAQPARELLAANLAQAVTELNDPILPQAVSGIPWYHNVLIFEKLKDPVQRLWYAARTLEHDWMKSQPIVELTASIQARRASEGWFQQTLKDPYIFDFLTLHTEAIERDLESGLVDHIAASRRCPIHWSRTLQNTRPNHGRIRAARYCQTDRGRPVANQVGRFSARTAKKQLTKYRGN